MPDPIRISAKTLGALAMPDFCPRCFWIQMRADGLPYQIFPGIFNSIDAYGKKIVHRWFDRHGAPPPWLSSLGDIQGYVEPPHYSKFFVLDEESSVLLRGSPDGVLLLRNNSHVIIDYKTAKFTEHQDELFPLYEVQLNAYAYIGERSGLSPVSGLALVYTEPVTDDAAVANDANLNPEGFTMGFTAHVVPVQLNKDAIPPLMRQARAILDLAHPPKSKEGCEDCALLRGLFTVASS